MKSKNLKKAGMILMTAVMVAGLLGGCGKNDTKSGKNTKSDSGSGNKKTELTVFAAASMTETLEAVAKEYAKENPDVKITYNFDSSGTLKTQIEEGAECDIFISAAPKQMNQLEESGYIDSDTRFDLLENKVVLVAADRDNVRISSFDELADSLKKGGFLFVMGNEDVPVGQYTRKIFEYYGIDEAETAKKGVISYAGNVKEVTTQISEGLADCGVIYQTDAFSAGLKVMDTATEEMCGRVIYPAAVLKKSGSGEEAGAFLKYLTENTAREIFEGVGFTPLSE